MSPRSSIGCVQNDFRAYGTFRANCAPILSQDLHYLQTDRNEIPHDPRHLGFLSGLSKMIFEPNVCSTQTVHLSCTNTNTVSKYYETRFHMTHVTKEFHWVRPKTTSEPMIHSAEIVNLSCVKISTISKQTESSFHLSLITLEYHRVCPK